MILRFWCECLVIFHGFCDRTASRSWKGGIGQMVVAHCRVLRAVQLCWESWAGCNMNSATRNQL